MPLTLFEVKGVDQNGKIVIDQTVNTLRNGFMELWLDRYSVPLKTTMTWAAVLEVICSKQKFCIRSRESGLFAPRTYSGEGLKKG